MSAPVENGVEAAAESLSTTTGWLVTAGAVFLVACSTDSVDRARAAHTGQSSGAGLPQPSGPFAFPHVETPQGEWHAQAGDPANTRFSSLDQITVDNVASLKPVFTFETGLNGESRSLCSARVRCRHQALEPAGVQAERIAGLTVLFFIVLSLVWLTVMVMLALAVLTASDLTALVAWLESLQ